MLVLGSVRGPDSTGVAMIDIKLGDVDIVKSVGSPYDLFELKSFDSVVTMYGNNIFMGHCRKATRGDIIKSNAHPFHHGNIVGVHNGTLIRQPGTKRFGTDSESIFHSMDYRGVKETVESMDGAWALVWYDEDTEELNFLRNDQRSLWYAYSADMTKIYWASEYWMIMVAVERDGRNTELYKDKKGNQFFLFPSDWWFRVKLGDDKGKPLTILDPIELKGNVKPATTFFRPYRTPWDWEPEDLNDDLPFHMDPVGSKHTVITPKDPPRLPAPKDNTQTPAGSQSSSQSQTPSETSGENIPSPLQCMSHSQVSNKRNTSGKSIPCILDNGDITIFNGMILTPEEWRVRTVAGCNYCHASVTPQTVTKWLSPDMFLCSTCYPLGRATDQEVIPNWVHAE